MRNYQIIIITVLVAAITVGRQSIGQFKTEWTAQDKISRFLKQQHHWGQKGQAVANHGWSNYGTLKVVMDGPDYLMLSQWRGELLAEIYSLESKTPKLRAVSIPSAGLFYSPKDASSCKPDTIEQVGVYAEMALFYISELFPNGPDSIIDENRLKASGMGTELRFMQAVARIKPWSIEGAIEIKGKNQYRIKINKPDSTQIFDVEWAKQEKKAVSSSELLSNWRTCWLGINSTDNNGNQSLKTNIQNSGNILTFGQIREYKSNNL